MLLQQYWTSLRPPDIRGNIMRPTTYLRGCKQIPPSCRAVPVAAAAYEQELFSDRHPHPCSVDPKAVVVSIPCPAHLWQPVAPDCLACMACDKYACATMSASHAPASARVLGLCSTFAVPKADLTWGVCSKRCNTCEACRPPAC